MFCEVPATSSHELRPTQSRVACLTLWQVSLRRGDRKANGNLKIANAGHRMDSQSLRLRKHPFISAIRARILPPLSIPDCNEYVSAWGRTTHSLDGR